MNHAQLLLRSGDYAGARAELSALTAKAPAEAVAVMHQMAGEAAALAGDKASAVTSYEAALAALPPTDSETSAYFRARIAQLKK
jgi:predicted negative regulator of RcsB-dependent stress response